MTTPRLSVRNVTFRYRNLGVLDGVDLDVAPGETLALLGPNGAGKSTLLRIMAGTLPPGEGDVLLDGTALASLRGAKRARRLAFVPQETRLVFDFTVLEIALMGRFPRLGLLGIEGKSDIAAARRALDLTGVAGLAGRPISHLSSGERQRVLLARALAQEPETILLDEPTAFLDLGHQVRIHRLLAALNRERGLTIVFVSHDLNLAARYASRVALLSEGRIIAQGPPATVLTPETLRGAYGVDARVGFDPEIGVPIVQVLGPAGLAEDL